VIVTTRSFLKGSSDGRLHILVMCYVFFFFFF